MKRQSLLLLLSFLMLNVCAQQQTKVFTAVKAYCVDVQKPNNEGVWGKLKKGDELYIGDKIRVYDSSYVTLLEPKGVLLEWNQSGDFFVDSLPRSGKQDLKALAMYETLLNPMESERTSNSLVEAINNAKPVQWNVTSKAWLLQNKVKLRWNSEADFVLKITDMSGKLLKEQLVSGGMTELNFETVSCFPKQYVLLKLYKKDVIEAVSPALAIYFPEQIEKDEKLKALAATKKSLAINTAAGQMAFASWAENNSCFIEAAEAKAKARQLMDK